MIIVHNVSRLKFGSVREALALMKEAVAIQKRLTFAAWGDNGHATRRS